MRSTVTVFVLTAVTAALAAASPVRAPRDPQAPSPAPASPARAFESDDDRAIYAAGVSLWRALVPLGLSAAEVDELMRGLRDAANGKPALRSEEVVHKVAAFRKARAEKAAASFRADSAAYLEKAASEKGAVTTASGLVFFDLRPGLGEGPKRDDTVEIHYRGTLVNGAEFDSSYTRKQPVRLPVGRLVPCWIEGLQMMKVGGKARFVCPSKLGYGDRGAPSREGRKPPIPGGATLVFEVELFGIVKPSARP